MGQDISLLEAVVNPSQAPVEQGGRRRKTVANELVCEDFEELSNHALSSGAGFTTSS